MSILHTLVASVALARPSLIVCVMMANDVQVNVHVRAFHDICPMPILHARITMRMLMFNELAMRHVPQVKPREDNLAGPPGRRGDQVGGFTLMSTKDLEKVAPMWLSFTTAVRNDPTVSFHQPSRR